MKTISIKYIGKYVGESINIDGWVYNSRRSGQIGFLSLRDGYGIVQCIIEKSNVGNDLFESFKRATQESSLSVRGKVVDNSRAPGGFEIIVEKFTLHQLSNEYPITPKEHGIDFLMNHRHLWMRSRKQHAILKIRHQIIKSIRDFFDNNDFTLIYILRF